MASATPQARLALAYEKAARDYERSLPPEHFMEATPQATQRKITLESLDLVHARRLDVQVFNELLVQYPRPGKRRFGQVVPDNMVVLSDQPIQALNSYNVPLEPAPPFWVLEYVSRNSERKDYDESFYKYEHELQVPYCLLFDPETQKLGLYRHTGTRFVLVKPTRQGRRLVRPLNVEVGLLEGWVRFWYQGKLLPLPADIQEELDQTRQALDEAERRVAEEKRRADDEKRRVAEERRRAEASERRATELERRLEGERAAREALERQLEQLRRNEPRAGRRSNGPRLDK
jgi:Uma2 family endonuclease